MPMDEPEAIRPPIGAPPVASPGLLGQLTFFLLMLRGKLQSMRRKQYFVVLAVCVLVVVVLQIEERAFMYDLKMEVSMSSIPKRTGRNDQNIFEKTAGGAKKTAFEAVTAVSVPVGSHRESVRDKSKAEHAAKKDQSQKKNEASDLGPAEIEHRKTADRTQATEQKVALNGPDDAEQNKTADVGSNDQTGDEVDNSASEESETANMDRRTYQTIKTDESQEGNTELEPVIGETDKNEMDAIANTEQRTKNRAPNSTSDTGSKAVVDLNDEAEDGRGESFGRSAGYETRPITKVEQNEQATKVDLADSEALSPEYADKLEGQKPANERLSVKAHNVNQTAMTDAAGDVTRNLHTDKLVRNIGFNRTACFSVSGGSKEHICAPSVVIAGYEKCGTSALYYKLTKHPEIVGHPKWKENCPAEDSTTFMWSWFEEVPVLESSTSNGLLLNGCIGFVARPVILKELQRLNPNLKVLAAFRNYADWAYSFYGYRCYPGYDEGCNELEKPNKHGPWKETRTPENFAKLVKETKEAGKSPYESFGVIEPNVDLFRQWLENLMDIVGREAVKIIKQENLSYYPRETLADVAKFLEIDPAKFPEEAYTLVSNTNDRPAHISSVKKTATKAEVAAVINSGIVMRNDTRTILNEFWRPECEWLRDNFDVHFSEVC